MRLHQLFVDPGVRSLVGTYEKDAARRIQKLTPQQQLVMEQMLDGHSNKVIAYRMGISQRTVENHRAAIHERTETKSISALMRLAILADIELRGFDHIDEMLIDETNDN